MVSIVCKISHQFLSNEGNAYFLRKSILIKHVSTIPQILFYSANQCQSRKRVYFRALRAAVKNRVNYGQDIHSH